jgi:hypothetical protein
MLGGIFALTEQLLQTESKWPFDKEALLTVNARSALYLLLKQRQPKRVWLPAYLCPVLLKALPPEQAYSFYAINTDLKPDFLGWTQKLSSEDFVIAIAYFGFTNQPFLQALQDSPADVLIDASQAFFLKPDHPDWYYLYSPRKWAGIPDGGILLGPQLPRQDKLLAPVSENWLAMIRALLLRRDFDLSGKENLALQREWFGLFQQAEAQQPIGAMAMSDLSRALLSYSLDYSLISQKRRANYLQLLEAFSEWAVYPELPAETTPLGFALRHSKRDQLRNALSEKQIYCPLHWPLEKLIPAEFKSSYLLTEQLLTIPCDQRYGPLEMDYLIAQIRTALMDI